MFNRRRIKELECQVASLETGYQGLCKLHFELQEQVRSLGEHVGVVYCTQKPAPITKKWVEPTPLGALGGGIGAFTTAADYEGASRAQNAASMRGEASFYPAPDFGQGK